MAATTGITLSPEGTLREAPLAGLLGAMGLLRATCLFELSHQKLTRRYVFDGGSIEAVISNARDDRFIDWIVAHQHARLPEGAKGVDLLERLEASPLTARIALEHGLIPAPQVGALLREHLLALLGESAEWPRCEYKIQPGKVALGDEPRAGLHATAAGLALARAQDSTRRNPRNFPAAVVSRVSGDDASLVLDVDEKELALIEYCAEPAATADLAQQANLGGMETVTLLWNAGLLSPATLPEAEKATRETETLTEVDAQELESWLQAAEKEDLAGVLGIPAAATPGEARKAYYRAVRRFHPDRFRSGPLKDYHDRVDSVFRLVPEALKVFTDPKARKRWDERHQRPAGPDPEKIAQSRLLQARKLAGQGRRGDAVTSLEQGLVSAPDHLDLQMGLALLLVGNPRRRAEAIVKLEKLAEKFVTRADILSALALAQLKDGKTSAAESSLNRARAIDRTDLVARALAGDAAARTKVRQDPFLAPLL